MHLAYVSQFLLKINLNGIYVYEERLESDLITKHTLRSDLTILNFREYII